MARCGGRCWSAPTCRRLTEMDKLLQASGPADALAHRRAAGRRRRLARDGYRLGIATDDAEASAIVQAEAMGLVPHMDFIVGYDSGHGGKPEPGMVLAFAESSASRPPKSRSSATARTISTPRAPPGRSPSPC